MRQSCYFCLEHEPGGLEGSSAGCDLGDHLALEELAGDEGLDDEVLDIAAGEDVGTVRTLSAAFATTGVGAGEADGVATGDEGDGTGEDACAHLAREIDLEGKGKRKEAGRRELE